jgi:hypothetical protein
MVIDMMNKDLSDLANRFQREKGLTNAEAKRMSVEKHSGLSDPEIKAVLKCAREFQERDGFTTSEALQKATRNFLETKGGSVSKTRVEILASVLAAHPEASQLKDDPLFILSKRIEREQGLDYRSALAEASRQLEAARVKEESEKPKPPEEKVCGNCAWFKTWIETGSQEGCYLNPPAANADLSVPRVEKWREACSHFKAK